MRTGQIQPQGEERAQSLRSSQRIAQIVQQRLDALGQISEEEGRLTRTYGSPAMCRANELVAGWMREAGMSTRTDAIGNLIGHYSAAAPRISKIFLLGSHLDTVRDAGKFDGPLGVLVAIACVERLAAKQKHLPFTIEIAGFADEEGVRFQSTYLGSKAVAAIFSPEDLKRTDAQGTSLADAIRNFGGDPANLANAGLPREHLLGYAEVHIEQGPVLEQKNLAVGVVTAIAGQTRARLTFIGKAGHAGTTPMNLRQDALCAAAEYIAAVEALAQNRGGLAATVGEISVAPGASNVIPGQARLSLDVRHPEDNARQTAVQELQNRAADIAARRNTRLEWQVVHETSAVTCDVRLSALLSQSVNAHQRDLPLLHSGAGHDAAAMAACTRVAMLFVRCKDGLSHHPDEFASVADIGVAIEVMSDFLERLGQAH